MAITEPLPQWEQDSMEVLITDVIEDPDNPDNPGGDEGIGAVDGGLQSAVSLRPNPSSGVTTVSCAEAITDLTVRDMAGRVVLRKAACGTTATFDTTTLRKGVYLVKVTTVRGTVTKKLVVE
ncbi:MAG: T9SS type A sorting domain-containing protein [Bacteroidales bacterium]|nr:T9SS type A sorting domain-containing protein [Bacteroidales bacterium]